MQTNKNRKIINHPLPVGFSALGMNADVSFKKTRKDLALFYSHLPASGAGVFTRNLVKAAPVLITQQKLLKTKGQVRAIAVNSGSANAATGPQGMRDAKLCAGWVASNLDISPDMVWLASTGVIGIPIKMKKYHQGINKLAGKIKSQETHEGLSAAEAIMTTDTVPKMTGLTFDLHGTPVRIWGCAKGSGMIHPDLGGPRGKLHATMLSFILTDANIKPAVLQRALERVTDKTFNCVSIDGDTSTNDFVGIMANGGSGAPLISHPRGKYYDTFCKALMQIGEILTTEIALDGEGAECLVQIFVEGARTEMSARKMAAVIASSPLVKTAIHGSDPNWGRVLMAMGRSGVKFEHNKVKIWLGDIMMCNKGMEVNFPEKKAIAYMKTKRVVIRVDLGLGRQWARYKTCDFTGQYVGINAGYRT